MRWIVGVIPRGWGASIISMLFKMFLCVFAFYGALTFTRVVYSNRKLSIKSRALIDTNGWQNELNKRMVQSLQKEVREKEKLLNYRGKVIGNLRLRLADLNATNVVLRKTLVNLTRIIVALKTTNDAKNTSGDFNIEFDGTTPFPPHLKDSAERPSRPCCMALKRMTDILRIYMETTQELREQVAWFQNMNISEHVQELAEQEKLKFNADNCSAIFNGDDVRNSTRRAEKYALYQTYTDGLFYETFSSHKLLKQKSKSKSYHRNLDFARAARTALQDVTQTTRLPSKGFQLGDSLLKYDELGGAEYRVSFVYNNTRTFSVKVVKSYGPIVVRGTVREVTDNRKELINIIVPLSGRSERLSVFLENVKRAVDSGENIFLTVVIYGRDVDNEIKKTVRKFSADHKFDSYDIFKKHMAFNRGRALHDGIMRWNGYHNVLMFLCDIDMHFDVGFLQRCRKHTVSGRSVYIPVVFSLYNPEVLKNTGYNESFQEIGEQSGTWRTMGYGMVCTYRSDYLQAKGFNLRITGWGGEDVSLYYRFIKRGYEVVRTPDPGLRHVWHEKTCSLNNLSKRQYETCIGSRARYEGSQRQLGILLLRERNANPK